MSLLMDALKKAEETKQRQAGEHHTVPPGVSTPVTPGANAAAHADNSPLPDLSLHSDMVDADLASVSATPRTTHTGSVAQDAPGKAAARGVFAAKTRRSAAPSTGPKFPINRKMPGQRQSTISNAPTKSIKTRFKTLRNRSCSWKFRDAELIFTLSIME